jgi:hypothetical protein
VLKFKNFRFALFTPPLGNFQIAIIQSFDTINTLFGTDDRNYKHKLLADQQFVNIQSFELQSYEL